MHLYIKTSIFLFAITASSMACNCCNYNYYNYGYERCIKTSGGHFCERNYLIPYNRTYYVNNRYVIPMVVTRYVDSPSKQKRIRHSAKTNCNEMYECK